MDPSENIINLPVEKLIPIIEENIAKSHKDVISQALKTGYICSGKKCGY